MEKCINCEHCKYSDWFEVYRCNIKQAYTSDDEIPHPYFMGGSKKCPCYKRREKEKRVFEYPPAERAK